MADTVVLILSGLQIHYPGFAVFGTMQTARFLHLVSGYFFLFLGVLHVYFFFAPGKRKIAMPHLEDLSGIGPVREGYGSALGITAESASVSLARVYGFWSTPARFFPAKRPAMSSRL